MWRYLGVIAGLCVLTACAQFGQPAGTATPQGGQRQATEFQREGRDWSIPATDTLRSGKVYNPTPTTIPGGKVVKTLELQALNSTENKPLLINVLQGFSVRSIPGSVRLSGAGNGGNFDDKVQEKLETKLNALTQGNRHKTLVFYCLNPECWLAYNAALRAMRLGYTDVAWYRGGIHAWEASGAPLLSTEDDDWADR